MTLFSASIHARASGVSELSSQRYGSATLVPKKSSTWSTFFATGYVNLGASGCEEEVAMIGLSRRSWKSKLKSVDGETACIFAWSMVPSGLSAKVMNASARSSRSRHRTTNVSYCQCSRSPTSEGVFVNRITSLPPSSAMAMSPYHASR